MLPSVVCSPGGCLGFIAGTHRRPNTPRVQDPSQQSIVELEE
jgi:hypothetical protein